MKTRFPAIACILLASCCISAVAQITPRKYTGYEPAGFRGIKWGQNLSETENLKSIGTLDFRKYEDIFDALGDNPVYYYLKEWRGRGYVNDNDIMKIGYADVNEIIYLFLEDRFYGTVVESAGSTNRNELERAVTAWLGSPTSEVKKGIRYAVIWERSGVRVVLDYNNTMLASKRDIKLFIISKEMENRFIGF